MENVQRNCWITEIYVNTHSTIQYERKGKRRFTRTNCSLQLCIKVLEILTTSLPIVDIG